MFYDTTQIPIFKTVRQEATIFPRRHYTVAKYDFLLVQTVHDNRAGNLFVYSSRKETHLEFPAITTKAHDFTDDWKMITPHHKHRFPLAVRAYDLSIHSSNMQYSPKRLRERMTKLQPPTRVAIQAPPLPLPQVGALASRFPPNPSNLLIHVLTLWHRTSPPTRHPTRKRQRFPFPSPLTSYSSNHLTQPAREESTGGAPDLFAVWR